MRISKLPVCVDVNHGYLPKAEYSIRMLLQPLGISPMFQSQNELADVGIYYGQQPAGLHPEIIILPMASDCEAFFDTNQSIDLNKIKWVDILGVKIPVLFSSEKGDDLVASAFYWLSGWHEWTVQTRDQHGRFPHSATLQEKLKVSHLPVVDYYRALIQEQLIRTQIRFEPRSWAGKEWAICPTIDVDYLKQWRLGMIFREKVEYFLLNARKKSASERWGRLVQFVKSYCSPGDAFQSALNRMHHYIRRYGKGTVFFKAGAHGPNDVEYKLNQPYVWQMVKNLLSDSFEIGLHPSYHASDHQGYLRNERSLLTQCIGDAPVSVRNHYLRYHSLITPHLQVGAGFRIDSSLGYAECSGFRNGTCMPFLKFDCRNNQVMDLWEMPLLMMDGTLFNRENLSVKDAISKSADLLLQCKKFGGVGVALWHNVMGEEMDYPGWKEHFEHVIPWSHQHGAYIGSLRGALESWLGHQV